MLQVRINSHIAVWHRGFEMTEEKSSSYFRRLCIIPLQMSGDLRCIGGFLTSTPRTGVRSVCRSVSEWRDCFSVAGEFAHV